MTLPFCWGNGDGTFQSPIVYTVGERNVSSITVGDFNGDGVPDLAATDSNNSTLSVPLSISFRAVSPAALNFGSQGKDRQACPRLLK